MENENICFAAYLTGGEENLFSKHKILSVMLFRDDDRKVIKSGQFVLQGGVASGMLTVPDSIAGGNYHLFAYTDIVNKEGEPMVSFIGNIVIKNTRPQKVVAPFKSLTSANDQLVKSAPQVDTVMTVKVAIETDREIYKPREIVKLKISITDLEGQPVRGLFSIAAVQTNRLANGYQKINLVREDTSESYPQENERQINIDTIDENQVATYGRQAMVYRGKVTRNRRIVKKPIEIVLLNTPSISSFSTDAQGNFELEQSLLYSETSSPVRLLPKGTATGFEISVSNPFDSLDAVLARSLKISGISQEQGSTSEDFQLDEFEKYDELDKVTITASTGNTLYGYKGKPGPNPCGDYVDEYDYLNYEFSKNKYQPVVGKQYKKRTDLNEMRTMFKVDPVHYTGCRTEEKKNGLNIEPIHYNQSLPIIDTLISEPQFLSTLLWRPFMLTESEGNTELNFVTGDIAGSFTIMIQGITDAGVFSGSALITVKK
ncbi:MAG: hypothetical protein EOO02_01350 [Chitinophagaceae bacterium]|nr:MAG: hypothetical protein EOO02_01350 [Chitinophagaceae bacterium]